MLNINEIQMYKEQVASDIRWKITTYMKGLPGSNPVLSFAIAYMAYIAQVNKIDDPTDLFRYAETNFTEQRNMFVKELCENSKDIIIQISEAFTEKELRAYMFVFPTEGAGRKYEEISGTPTAVSKLAMKILNIDEKDLVADFGSGSGSFLLQAAMVHEKSSFYGIELNKYSYEISKIRAELFLENVEIEQGDMFGVPKGRQFDKIFSNYPFGQRVNHLNPESEYLEYIKNLNEKIPETKKATSSDWYFNSVIVDHLKESGKAVMIMTNGSTWNSLDQKMREHFIRNGLVEAVITLPHRLFDWTTISTTMLVLSKGNQNIRLIDASSLCEKGRRQNNLTDENIEQILHLLTDEGEDAITVDLETIRQNDFVLNPARYLETPVVIEDGVPFGSLMKRITRGAPLSAKTLDEMVSDESTDIQYLMLVNIKNGMISDDLPYLKEFDSSMEKYCIRNHNLVLSKNGAPFKVAVAELDTDKKVIGNGNLFIIELDEERVNPYFIKAFFDSEGGANVLKSIAVGASIPNISADALKKLIVPLPPIEKQNEIADLYQAKQEEIKILQRKIQRAQDELKSIFGERQ